MNHRLQSAASGSSPAGDYVGLAIPGSSKNLWKLKGEPVILAYVTEYQEWFLIASSPERDEYLAPVNFGENLEAAIAKLTLILD